MRRLVATVPSSTPGTALDPAYVRHLEFKTHFQSTSEPWISIANAYIDLSKDEMGVLIPQLQEMAKSRFARIRFNPAIIMNDRVEVFIQSDFRTFLPAVRSPLPHPTLLQRIAESRSMNAHFKSDHLYRLLTAYVCADKATRSRISGLTKAFEALSITPDADFLPNLKETQMLMREQPTLFCENDPLTKLSDADLSERLESNQSPFIFSVSRSDISRLFLYLDNLSLILEKIEADIAAGASSSEAELLRNRICGTGGILQGLNNIVASVTRFIEANFTESTLPNTASKKTIAVADKTWEFLVGIQSPVPTMLGVLHYQFGSMDDRKHGIIISCSGGKDGLAELTKLVGSKKDASPIQFLIEDTELTSPAASGTGIAPLEESVRQFCLDEFLSALTANDISTLALTTNPNAGSFLERVPSIREKAGTLSISTHNGIACAYVKLWTKLQELKSCDPSIEFCGIQENWYGTPTVPHPALQKSREHKAQEKTWDTLHAQVPVLAAALGPLSPTHTPLITGSRKTFTFSPASAGERASDTGASAPCPSPSAATTSGSVSPGLTPPNQPSPVLIAASQNGLLESIRETRIHKAVTELRHAKSDSPL
ncbi:hypothetical protein EBR96_01195, partial [bacterium]|nr:hypothetical protein [bacterium]